MVCSYLLFHFFFLVELLEQIIEHRVEILVGVFRCIVAAKDAAAEVFLEGRFCEIAGVLFLGIIDVFAT